MARSLRPNLVTAVVAAALLAPSGVGTAADAPPIKIGFLGGFTGACAPIVKGELHGVELAIDRLNATGGVLGRKLVLVQRDTQTKADEGSRAARDLVDNEKVDVLTGVCSSSVLLSVAAISKQTQTPLYSTAANTQKANFEAYQAYYWQTAPNVSMEAVAVAQLVASHPEWTTVTPIGFDYEWGHAAIATFLDRLKSLRPDIVINPPLFAKLGETDMQPFIAAASRRNPDVVAAALYGATLESLVRQGAASGLFAKSNLVTLATLDALQACGDAMPKSRVYGVARAPFNALSRDSGPEFVRSYKAKYGAYPDDWAVLAYDGLMFYAAAVRRAGGVEGAALMKAVGEIKYDGLRGAGMSVRAYDGQMDADVYTGAVAFEGKLGSFVLEGGRRLDGRALMLPERSIAEIRAIARIRMGAD